MAEKKEQPSISRYPVEELAANAQALFDVKPEVLAGALHGVEVAEMSVSEAKALIRKFLREKVK
ncbi:hypothetical protein ABU162_04450 [Paenibacillus thiaminolyticus]|uniref:YqzN/YkzM domain-containing protein n=1 Tax=Paenibacillus thiaminolyticus TaxID=49283 RepID=A0A3A3GT03_PANTH|nr:hypothetical protein [Paenibacillus thiaminolyticus]RJG26706.1 hypothetical protein DQX05_01350 [Paenibacillus thiaminolyticus]